MTELQPEYRQMKSMPLLAPKVISDETDLPCLAPLVMSDLAIPDGNKKNLLPVLARSPSAGPTLRSPMRSPRLNPEPLSVRVRRTSASLKEFVVDDQKETTSRKKEYEINSVQDTLDSPSRNSPMVERGPIRRKSFPNAPVFVCSVAPPDSPTSANGGKVLASPFFVNPIQKDDDKFSEEKIAEETAIFDTQRPSVSSSAYGTHGIKTSMSQPVSISRRFIGQNEWNQLLELTEFSEIELGKLNKVFVLNQVSGLIPKLSFWNLISITRGFIESKEPLPLLPNVAFLKSAESSLPTSGEPTCSCSESYMCKYILSQPSYLRVYLEEYSLITARMFSIFGMSLTLLLFNKKDVIKRDALTFLEFALAFAVLCGKAEKTFLDRASFSFDVFDLHQDQRISLEELIITASVPDIYVRWPNQPPPSYKKPSLRENAENVPFMNAVVKALVCMYTTAFRACVPPNSEFMSRAEYSDMVSRFPAIMDPFTLYFDDFVENMSLALSLNFASSESLPNEMLKRDSV